MSLAEELPITAPRTHVALHLQREDEYWIPTKFIS